MAVDLPRRFGVSSVYFPTRELFDRFLKFRNRVTAFQIIHKSEGISFFGSWTGGPMDRSYGLTYLAFC